MMGNNISYQELLDNFRSLENDFQSYKLKTKAWKEAKNHFYSLSNRTQDGIYNFNLSIKKYVYTNPSFIKMFGHPCKDIVTTDSVMERILPVDKQKLKKRVDASLLGKSEGDEIEYRCITLDGSTRWMHDRWVVIKDDNETPVAIEGIVRDITEMKNIINIKDYLESILESCMDCIIVTNEKGFITLINKGAEALFHIKRSDLLNMFIGDIIRNEFNGSRNFYELILEHTPTSNYELQAQLLDGTSVPILISSAFLKGEKNQIVGTISYMRDISVIKEAEERIRTLSQQLIRAQEVEMSSIARDLHDHLAQNLYSLNIQLSTFFNEAFISKDKYNTQAKELLDSLHDIIDDVRKTVFNIHPTGLDTLGLTNTIHDLCSNISQIYDLAINFKTAGLDPLNLSFDVKIALYRLIQEGLNNIVKHADANNAYVRLVYSYPKIILRMEDDGKGFDIDQSMNNVYKEGCMGIWSMKERVALLSGEMTIHSNQKMGTIIVIEIPYDEE